MIWDAHMHCNFSGDSDTPPASMIETAIQKGLPGICFTDHHDIDYPKLPEEADFLIEFDSYLAEMEDLKDTYRKRLTIHTGVELGLQPSVASKNLAVTTAYPLDFVIGSVHTINGCDPYYGNYFDGRTVREAYEEYFLYTLENIRAFTDFDVLGHLDYMIRYNPAPDKSYKFMDFCDYIDEILTILIDSGRGIELNTSGLRVGLGQPHPQTDILKRYKELGGEILTIGSDAHRPEHLAYAFETVPDLLKSCGFTYYTVFQGRKGQFLKL